MRKYPNFKQLTSIFTSGTQPAQLSCLYRNRIEWHGMEWRGIGQDSKGQGSIGSDYSLCISSDLFRVHQRASVQEVHIQQ